MIKSTLRTRSLVVAVLVAIVVMAMPSIATATTYSFIPGSIANGMGWVNAYADFGVVVLDPEGKPDMWFSSWRDDGEGSTTGNFWADADGWGMMSTDGWTLPGTPVDYKEFVVEGHTGEPWWCNGFDVNNTTGDPVSITITSSAGEGMPERTTVVTVPTGVSHVDLTNEGHVNIPDGWGMGIYFEQMVGLGFNNFNAGPASEAGSGAEEEENVLQTSGSETLWAGVVAILLVAAAGAVALAPRREK